MLLLQDKEDGVSKESKAHVRVASRGVFAHHLSSGVRVYLIWGERLRRKAVYGPKSGKQRRKKGLTKIFWV